MWNPRLSNLLNTVLLFFMTCQAVQILHGNEAQRKLFSQRYKTMENIPLTQDTLQQWSRCVAHQAGIWTTSNLASQQTTLPEGHGWSFNRESQVPVRSTLPLSSIACTEVVKCGCNGDKGCGAGCSLRKAQWKCTKLCSYKCKTRAIHVYTIEYCKTICCL